MRRIILRLVRNSNCFQNEVKPDHAMDALQIFNSVEAIWWMLVGVFVFVKAQSAVPSRRRLGVASAVWFVLFGVSDVAEVLTGAWWRPLW